jgi:hypothetical protein
MYLCESGLKSMARWGGSPCFQGPSTPGNHMTWSVLKWLVLCFMHFMHIKKIQVFMFYMFYAHKENTYKYSHFQQKKPTTTLLAVMR